jgi:predicted nucleic acid-binding protein
MKVFLDTNVLVSAMATRGLCDSLSQGILEKDANPTIASTRQGIKEPSLLLTHSAAPNPAFEG